MFKTNLAWIVVGFLCAAMACAAGYRNALAHPPAHSSQLVRLPPVSHPGRQTPVTPPPSAFRVSPWNNESLIEPSDARESPARSVDLALKEHPLPEQQPRRAAYLLWWDAIVTRPQRGGSPMQVDVDSLIVAALQQSPYLRSVRYVAQIEGSKVFEQAAEFDPLVFAESKFISTSEPVGNVLDTGGPPRLREQDFGQKFGVRQKNQFGGRFEAAQRLGLEDSNSLFFNPENQGNSRLTLNYTQPLLNGRGVAYNTSLIAIADFRQQAAMNEVRQKVQEHSTKVASAFWELYEQRAVVAQRERDVRRAELILNELRARQAIDASRSQVLRAEAARATREASLENARVIVRNIETRLRILVGFANLSPDLELVPAAPPISKCFRSTYKTHLSPR